MAWARYLRRRDDEAIDALREARIHVLFTRRASDMLAGMVRRDRRNRRELRELAAFTGAAVST